MSIDDDLRSETGSAAGLYALKAWFAARLTLIRAVLVRHRVNPNTISVAGILFAACAGASLALLPAPVAAVPVTLFLVARLAAANLDGSVARESGRQTRWGGVLNEIGDRLADLLVLAGLLAHVSLPLALGVLLASSVPSWVSLAGAAAGLRRINGGPVGKTERCLLMVLAAATGWYTVFAVIVLAGSALTGLVRLVRLSRHHERATGGAVLAVRA
jgi:CDP-diacylglycerol---glycerol-3-phosphate 3-phosphatidyltransferase